MRLIQKDVCEKSFSTIANDVTVKLYNSNATIEFKKSVSMTIIFKIPSKKDGCGNDDAPLVEISKINEMLNR